MKYVMKAKEIYTESEVLYNASLLIEDGIIKQINPANTDCEVFDFGNNKIFPGLIDIHVHGGGGHDTMDLTYDAINDISKFKIIEGVTSFCPTTVTTSLDKTTAAIVAVKDAIGKVEGAKIIGSFLEGPYINPKFKGAHPEQYIREIDLGEIDELIKAGNGSITSIAIAPEKEGGTEAIKYINSQGVSVRIGHSGATCRQAIDAIDAGATAGIHTFNAMTPLNHREPGMAGALLSDDRIYCELICDLIHVAPEAVKILYKCKTAEKLILITDCMMAGGLPDGNYNLCELPVVVDKGIARITNGALAGSTLNLMNAVKNIHLTVGVPLLEAVTMATITPARLVGISEETGSIAVGKKADLTVVDNNLDIQAVAVEGIFKYKK